MPWPTPPACTAAILVTGLCSLAAPVGVASIDSLPARADPAGGR